MEAPTHSDPEIANPHERDAQTFPRLDPEAAERLAAYGTVEQVSRGTSLFSRGQRRIDFFLVLEGSIEIFDTDRHGTPETITVHRERQFTGEVDLFNDRQILVSGRTSSDSRLVRLRV